MLDKVSIIIPMYNASFFLKYTIESCLNQSYKNYEIILIDDCSTDNTYDIALNYVNKYSVISVIKNKQNLGFIRTVNLALDLAQGEYILVLGNDDILDIQHLEIMISHMKSYTNNVLTYCQSRLIDEKGGVMGTSNTIDINLDVSKIGYMNPINACGLIMKKEALFRVGKYPIIENCPNYGEWMLWIKMMNIGSFSFVKEIKSNYRIHSNNLTNSFMNYDKIYAYYKYNLLCMDCALTSLKFTLRERCKIKIKRINYRIKMFYFINIKSKSFIIKNQAN